ncbi:MAG: TIGR03617 family F420-dependent LLM class oxidoreductase [Gammaproteobacteria bacterium]|nr:TIGR03617 family F420-dependent LLM class oxidoreductase [Gammaproteobacteria bacterium]NIM74118.1 TIGR03617 family F420-dependent LLM class oxidoreductase [Gammaproteobacteria bacterium]NIN39001.1 TIGR03617 family F420-dependent LLM class oxidoreductase [Gammaproteobacteria bacterium]NIO25894.1 TIGR03617 family F420-dependent LLM class oxidoreductase [Gammaproteobacteria bacterium]NIO66525.1 TIGR03617 family F420-dependent LLM class oxidoreductase [Gammaproteobacteria bacterium]
MHIDAPLRDFPLAEVGEEARRLERMGFGAMWSFETRRDPFLPLLQVALATENIRLGTNIAVAFARTPFSMAMTAWDLQRASRGRLFLGLGTQVRAHVERRFSADFEHPAARVADYIHCLRAIWDTFQTGAKPDYEGPFYRFKLINEMFTGGPIDHPHIPVFLAGVNPRMARAAGEAADGFSVHPMHSPAYLREVVRPAIDEGARTRGKRVEELTLVADCFVVEGDTEKERNRSEEHVRRQIAIYASTPSYRGFLEFHGHPEIGKQLSALMREGRLREMPALISDALLSTVAVSAADGDLATQIRDRYADDLVQRVLFYEPVPEDVDEKAMRAFIGRACA